MKPTTIEEILLGFLRTSKAKKGTQAIVFLLMKTEDQMIEMCEFLSKYEEATDDEILSEARKISDTSGLIM